MNLGNIFQSRNQNIKQADTARPNGTVTTGERNYRIQNEIRNFTPGQTIQGEVVGKDGSTVQIALDSETVLTARLERDLNIALGQNMSFEVKASSGSLLSLTPLYANMANEATILKALSAAGLSQNADNMRMVSDMMQEGMSIDRETIAYVNRQLADFPDANPSSVIQMIRLGLPVTELNIEQFEQYKNYEHQIVQSAEQIMEELPQVYSELVSEGRDTEAVSFYEQIIKTFLGGGATEGTDGEVVILKNAFGETQTAGAMNDTAQNSISGEALPLEKSEEGLAGSGLTDTILQDDMVRESTKQGNSSQTEMLQDTVQTTQELPDKSALSPKMWQELGDMIQKMGAEAELAAQIGKGDISSKQVLSLIHDFFSGHAGLISQEGIQETVKELFGSKAFASLLKTEMTNQWLLKPGEVAEKENVERFYERIREQTAKINEAFQMVDKADTAAARSVQNLQSNVDFMNQMNQLFTYVQLPLKMAGNQAHGDLYVYTNKKNLAKNDGNVSALLHLDMEHLGPLDVYVTMQQNQHKVQTNFTLQDEASLDLIAKHIHILDERLAKRGYSMNANFQLKEDAGKETNVMQEILTQNKNISVLSKTSFDMRA